MDELNWKEQPCRVTDQVCFAVGRVSNATTVSPEKAAFVKIVFPNPEQTTCPTSEPLCRGVVTKSSTHDAVRREIQAATSSPSPTATSATPTNSSTPTTTSSAPTDEPVTPTETAPREEPSSEAPEPDDSDLAIESDPPVDEQ
jgi:hypothetical protein